MSIASSTLGDAPQQLLQQALYGSVPEIKPYDALGELNKRVKAQQMGSAMQGDNAIQQAQQMAQKPPVAQELMSQLDQGVGSLPVPETKAYASGGVVAFAEGGMPLGEREQADRAAIIRELEGMGMTAGKMLAIGHDVFTMPVRGLAMVYNQLARVPRAFGTGQTLIPDEFTGGSLMPMYNKFFPTQQPGNRVGTEKGRATNTGNAEFTPPQPAVTAPPAPAPGPGPSSGPGIGGGNRVGSAGSRAGIASLTAPTYNPITPQYEMPEVKDPATARAEDEASASTAMSEYDTRMGKFKQRALDMQEGKGIKKPSRMDRGMSAFMSGASEEYAAARRAGVRPSIGMALASASGAARKGDAALQEKIEAMREKGFEAEAALENSRMAYKAGQQELGAKYRKDYEQAKKDALAIKHKMTDAEVAKADKKNAYDMELYKIAMQEQSKEKDRQTTIAAAGIRSSGADSDWKESNAVLQRYNSNENVKKAAKLRETVALVNTNSPLYKRAMDEAKALEQQAARETAAAFSNGPSAALAKQVLDGIVGGTSGATPGATQRIRFDAQGNMIK
jgi:hypothetical protein